jgi:hypothetical protein
MIRRLAFVLVLALSLALLVVSADAHAMRTLFRSLHAANSTDLIRDEHMTGASGRDFTLSAQNSSEATGFDANTSLDADASSDDQRSPNVAAFAWVIASFLFFDVLTGLCACACDLSSAQRFVVFINLAYAASFGTVIAALVSSDPMDVSDKAVLIVTIISVTLPFGLAVLFVCIKCMCDVAGEYHRF